MFWTTIHNTRWKTRSKSVWIHPFKYMFDSALSTCWSWHFKKIVSQNFDRKLGYEAYSSQICGMSAEWRAKTKCLEVSREHFECANNEENLCEKTSLWVKRNGFMAMMLIWKTTLNNGSQKHHSEPKNQGKFSQMWRWCWQCFFVCLWRCCTQWIFTSWP
jgi:hypothetical protein